MSDLDLAAWDRRTAELLEAAYVAAGDGPGGSGCFTSTEADWRSKRAHLADAFDGDGAWLDVGCANGHLMATLTAWLAERGITVEPHGLELLPAVADLARRLHPAWADRIWTGSVMAWTPPRRFDVVTALADCVPDARLGDLVDRLLDRAVVPGGRLVVSSYANVGEHPRDLGGELAALGHEVVGSSTARRTDGSVRAAAAWVDRRPG